MSEDNPLNDPNLPDPDEDANEAPTPDTEGLPETDPVDEPVEDPDDPEPGDL